MTRLARAACLALLTGALGAQQVPDLEIRPVGPFGVAAVDGPSIQRLTLDAGAALPTGETRLDTRSLLDPLGQIFSVHWAMSRILPQRNASGDPGVRWIENANASSGLPGFVGTTTDGGDPPIPVPGPHTLRLTVPVPAGSTGELFVEWSAFSGGVTDLAIDVGADGSVERATSARSDYTPASLTTRIPVVAGAGGVVVDVTQSAALLTPGAGSYFSLLEIYFRPAGPGTVCSVQRGAGPCDLALSGALGTDACGAEAVLLQLDGLTPSTLGLLFVGPAAATPLPLPGAACPLGVEPALNLFWFVDAPTRSWSFPVGNAQRLEFGLQAATYSFVPGTGAVVRTSNELRLRCQ